MVRRMYNSSRDLDWDTEVAPVVSEYCGRMMAAGYSEKYRKDIVKHALAIYDDKIKKNDSGDVPLNRPKGYKKTGEEKAEETEEKKMVIKGWICCSNYYTKYSWWNSVENAQKSCCI